LTLAQKRIVSPFETPVCDVRFLHSSFFQSRHGEYIAKHGRVMREIYEVVSLRQSGETRASFRARRSLRSDQFRIRRVTAAEALVVSLSETGRADWRRMAVLTGKNISSLQAQQTGLVFRSPEGHTWETADAKKLQAAESAVAVSSEFVASVDALGTVQPSNLKPGNIDARLGSPWILISYIRSFLCKLLSTQEKGSRSRTPRA
jgi:N12 class adenine-specific DNA methylase